MLNNNVTKLVQFTLKFFYFLIQFYVCCIVLANLVLSDEITKDLHHYLTKNYNKHVRPAKNNSDIVNVEIDLKLTRIIDLDQKNQILTTDVWFKQVWTDYRLIWNPNDFNNVTLLYLPVTDLWIPEIVLYNTANGKYEPLMITKATIHSNGRIVWRTPSIFRSSCIINVEFFPFDEQICYIKFSSWVYDGNHVRLKHANADPDQEIVSNGIDISNFTGNTEWDLMEVVSKINSKCNNTNSQDFKPDIKFFMIIRRKTLFYTINLLTPCICMSFLTVVVFVLPSESGEKITLSISILLALTLFFLLLVDIMPPTSITIPLFGKYLVFTITMVSLSTSATIYVLNIHHKSPKVHGQMPDFVRRIFLEVLPKFLFVTNIDKDKNWIFIDRVINKSHRQEVFTFYPRYYKRYSKTVLRVLKMARTMEDDTMHQKIKLEWKYLAMVLDRLLFYSFGVAFLFGTFYILGQAPTLYDNKKPILL